MILISFICLGAVSLILNVLYGIFGSREGWQGMVVRILTYVMLIIFSLVVAVNKSLTNTFTLFLSMALVLLLVQECSNAQLKGDGKYIVSNILQAVVGLFLSLSIMSLAGFNYLSLIGGILFGLAVGLFYWGFKHNEKNIIAYEVLSFAMLGLAVGMGINAVVYSLHPISAILSLIGSLFVIIFKIVADLTKEKPKLTEIFLALEMLGLTILIAGIYFY